MNPCSATDDGRWSVDQIGTRPVIVDLLNGTEHELIVDGRIPLNQAPLFVGMAVTSLG